MTFSIWFDSDETLWDRKGYLLTGLLAPADWQRDRVRDPELFSDVLPTFVELTSIGTVNLIEYALMPQGCEDLLPPFHARVEGPDAPSHMEPEMQRAATERSWAETCDRIERADRAADDVIVVSNSAGALAEATERGWITVWLNRDRIANLSDVEPTVQIHTLLDLPEALEAIDEARAAVAAALGASPLSPR